MAANARDQIVVSIMLWRPVAFVVGIPLGGRNGNKWYRVGWASLSLSCSLRTTVNKHPSCRCWEGWVFSIRVALELHDAIRAAEKKQADVCIGLEWASVSSQGGFVFRRGRFPPVWWVWISRCLPGEMIEPFRSIWQHLGMDFPAPETASSVT